MEINNNEAIKELLKATLLQSSFHFPKELEKKIVPTIEINPRLLKISNIIRQVAIQNATSDIIFTTPNISNIRFFLTGLTLSVVKDALSTSVQTAIQLTIDGAVQLIATIVGQSLTAQNQSITFSFPFPIQVDRNTNINVVTSSAVAFIRVDASLCGYLGEI